MESLVVKISGGLLYPPNPAYLAGLVNVIRRASREARLVVVAGGGQLARELIAAAREVGAGQGVQDLLGIEASRLNARLLGLLLGDLAPPEPPYSPVELLDATRRYRVVIVGGLQPGQSTNAVSMVAAELVGAGLVLNLLSGVPGIYERFPPRPGDEPLRCLSYEGVRRIVSSYRQVAGGYELLDHLALSMAERSRIRILFADGSDPGIILRVLSGERPGTLVGPGSDCAEG